MLCSLSAALYACIDSTHLPLTDRSDIEAQIVFEPGKQYHGYGQVVGMEIAACMCCGGYWLVTEEADSMLFGNLPENSGFAFDCNETFPVAVEYEFFIDSSICWQVKRLVTMQSIRKI